MAMWAIPTGEYGPTKNKSFPTCYDLRFAVFFLNSSFLLPSCSFHFLMLLRPWYTVDILKYVYPRAREMAEWVRCLRFKLRTLNMRTWVQTTPAWQCGHVILALARRDRWTEVSLLASQSAQAVSSWLRERPCINQSMENLCRVLQNETLPQKKKRKKRNTICLKGIDKDRISKCIKFQKRR